MTTAAFADANVILRFLVGDPPRLAKRARSLFEAVERGDLRLFIDELVLAEVAWVLRSFYRFDAARIAAVLQTLLAHEGLEVTDRAGLLEALATFADRNVDFVDAVVAVHMDRQGTGKIYSFDADFDRLPGVTRLVPGE